ncbi:MAG: hypothetical protein KF693_15370 [Nitrospira sp.]|nr:hypothetical protein [Nitrospira sp.]
MPPSLKVTQLLPYQSTSFDQTDSGPDGPDLTLRLVIAYWTIPIAYRTHAFFKVMDGERPVVVPPHPGEVVGHTGSSRVVDERSYNYVQAFRRIGRDDQA